MAALIPKSVMVYEVGHIYMELFMSGLWKLHVCHNFVHMHNSFHVNHVYWYISPETM